jgi:hypothetical protein
VIAILSAAATAVLASAARPLGGEPVAAKATSTPALATPPLRTAATTEFDPTKPGPCALIESQTTLDLDPAISGCKDKGCKLTLTLVAANANATTATTPARCTRPLPVVLVLPGFAARNYMYRDYADLLATWGYAAVSYEAPLLGAFPPLNDKYEGSAAFVALVASAASRAASSANVTLDRSSLKQPMAIGHSRGGKIAALQLASKACVTAALLDPVDGGLAPFFPPNPSAVAELRKSPPAAGALVIQAGIQGLCNGAIVGGDSLFWNALVAGGGSSGGSWRTILPKAGHGSLARLGPMFQPIAGLMCGGKVKKGGISEDESIRLAKTMALEWIERYWTGQGGEGAPPPAPTPSFCAFVAAESAAGRMTPVESADGRPVCDASDKGVVAAAAR